MFADHNHVTAIATAIGTLGGFQAAPEWFNTLAKTAVWNILMATVLVYQGGGNTDFVYSLVVATLFYLVIHLSKYIEVGAAEVHEEEKEVHHEVHEETEDDVGAESFMGYGHNDMTGYGY